MNNPEQDLRAFARRVQQLAALAASAPETDSLADSASELKGLANVLLQRNYDTLIQAQLEGIRDKLFLLWQQRGGRLFGKPARQPYPKGVHETGSVLQTLSHDLVAALDDKATSDSFRELSEQVPEEEKIWSERRAIEQAVARFDDRALACCWKTGLCETRFEPFLPGDVEHIWFARLKSRLREFAGWLVEERILHLLAALGKMALVLGVEVETLIEIDIPESLAPAQAEARGFMRDCIRQLAANVEDESVRRDVARKLGAAFTQDPDRLPPLFFLEYFEVLRGITRRGESAIAALTRTASVEATTSPIGVPELPVLSEDVTVFRDILLCRGPFEAITGPRLCELFEERTKRGMDEAEFRTSIVPLLKAWGLKNKPRVGYYFPADSQARRRG